MTTICWVLCTNAGGQADAVRYKLRATDGEHLDKAIEMATDDGYISPMIAFDENDINHAADGLREFAQEVLRESKA